MIKIKTTKTDVKVKAKMTEPYELAEMTIVMMALGEVLKQGIEKSPEIGQRVKADCIKAFTMAANGSSREEIGLELVRKSVGDVLALASIEG